MSAMWEVPTTDGQMRTLYRIDPCEISQSQKQSQQAQQALPPNEPRPAVVMLHGLSSNPVALHLKSHSLAQYIAQTGRTVYLAAVRGSEQDTSRPVFGFEDLLTHDLPAIIDAVHRDVGQMRFHVLGHSLGGILWLCLGLRLGQTLPWLSVATVASSLDYSQGQSSYARLAPLSFMIPKKLKIPYGRWIQRLARQTQKSNPWWTHFHVHPSNVKDEHLSTLWRHGFGYTTGKLLADLAPLAHSKPLIDAHSGKPFIDAAASWPWPLLWLSGSRDLQCPPAATQTTHARFPSQHSHTIPFGQSFGHQEEYGHFDLLIGRNAPQEVWPKLAAWFEQHDPSVLDASESHA